LRDSETKRLRGLQIDDELEARRLIEGDIARLRALQDFIEILCRPTEQLRKVNPISNQSAVLYKVAMRKKRGQPAILGECEDQPFLGVISMAETGQTLPSSERSANGRYRARLCENAHEPRTRRIVFSVVFCPR
jgi:hypothetical protein